MLTLEQRVWTKFRMEGDCFIFTGALSGGYGSIRDGEKTKRVHQWAYETYVGPIPTGLEPDHLCPYKACFNVAHLELVTHQVNMQRAPHRNRTKTVCLWGHPLTPENTYVYRGKRACKQCRLDRFRRYYHDGRTYARRPGRKS